MSLLLSMQERKKLMIVLTFVIFMTFFLAVIIQYYFLTLAIPLDVVLIITSVISISQIVKRFYILLTKAGAFSGTFRTYFIHLSRKALVTIFPLAIFLVVYLAVSYFINFLEYSELNLILVLFLSAAIPILIITYFQEYFFRYFLDAKAYKTDRTTSILSELKRSDDNTEIRLWKMNCPLNAMQVGFTSCEILFVGDLDYVLTYEELKAVLAHEVSHFILKHGTKKLLIFLLSLALFTTSLVEDIYFASSFGIYSYLVFILVTIITLIVLLLFISFISRYFEKEADINAIKYVSKQNLISSLIKLNITEKHRYLVFILKYFRTHPTLKQRIKYIEDVV